MAQQPASPDYRAQIELLPFYLNGTLAAEGCSMLDRALHRSADLRAAMADEQHLASRIKAGGLAITARTDIKAERLEALMAKIDETPQNSPPQPGPITPSATPASPDRVRALMAYLNPSRWHPAVALALALAVMAQAALLNNRRHQIGQLQKENFELASGPGIQAGKGSIVLELKDQAKWQDVSALLDQEALTIIHSGDFGTLTLASPKKGAELTAQLARLRQSPLVNSAEPAA